MKSMLVRVPSSVTPTAALTKIPLPICSALQKLPKSWSIKLTDKKPLPTRRIHSSSCQNRQIRGVNSKRAALLDQPIRPLHGSKDNSRLHTNRVAGAARSEGCADASHRLQTTANQSGCIPQNRHPARKTQPTPTSLRQALNPQPMQPIPTLPCQALGFINSMHAGVREP